MAKLKSGTRIYGTATIDNNLQVTSGPVFIGGGSSTGTVGQVLQVTGGTYVSGEIGIGTTNPTSKLHVVGDVRVGINTSQGVILTSPNGTKYRLLVSNAGTLSTVLVV